MKTKKSKVLDVLLMVPFVLVIIIQYLLSVWIELNGAIGDRIAKRYREQKVTRKVNHEN